MFFRTPIKKAAHKLFEANSKRLLTGELHDLKTATDAEQIVYDLAYHYCTENNLHLSTIHEIKSYFPEWAEKEIREAWMQFI